MPTRYVVMLSFPRGAPAEDERTAQQAFLKELQDEGALIMAGRFSDESGGGMAVLEAESLDAARERYSAAPVVTSGRADWEIRPWEVSWSRNP